MLVWIYCCDFSWFCLKILSWWLFLILKSKRQQYGVCVDFVKRASNLLLSAQRSNSLSVFDPRFTDRKQSIIDLEIQLQFNDHVLDVMWLLMKRLQFTTTPLWTDRSFSGGGTDLTHVYCLDKSVCCNCDSFPVSKE